MAHGLDQATRGAVLELPRLYGGMEVLARARARLPGRPAIRRALDDLERIAGATDGMVGGILFDLAELRGYRYHSGAVFSAYLPGQAHAVAKGGRYDEVGSVFGRARPATGFSIDLRLLCGALGAAAAAPAILAPHGGDGSLDEAVEALRAQGEVVVAESPGHEDSLGELNCDRRLVQRGGAWCVEKI